eukprot:TRINITY_DN19113_c0_g1_i1.p1 TRINITY_DN19113_c0_g1~~TRINITY_DN19113_c0_g1_i1.p1  ORF type:complete len:102 (-),score=7.45 TRINITY_DN19113_c0_g1_i1:207-512(-)
MKFIGTPERNSKFISYHALTLIVCHRCMKSNCSSNKILSLLEMPLCQNSHGRMILESGWMNLSNVKRKLRNKSNQQSTFNQQDDPRGFRLTTHTQWDKAVE